MPPSPIPSMPAPGPFHIFTDIELFGGPLDSIVIEWPCDYLSFYIEHPSYPGFHLYTYNPITQKAIYGHTVASLL